MKKLLISLFALSLIFMGGAGGVAHATTSFYGATTLAGGTSGCLDAINGALLSDGDLAVVITATYTYHYVVDIDLDEDEASPTYIVPDTNGTRDGSKIDWVLKAVYSLAASETVEGKLEIATDIEAEAKAEPDKALVPSNLAAIFLDEDAMGSNSATKICSQQSIKAYVDDTSGNAIIGDATSGRVLRNLTILIANGGVGNSIDVTGGRGPTAVEFWNASNIAIEEDLDEDETLTRFGLSIDGSRLTVLAAGLDGNAVAGLSAIVTSNLSTVDLNSVVLASGNNLFINFRNSDTGATADLRDLVNTGLIYVNITYLTAS